MQLCDGNLDVSAHDSLNSPGTMTSHEAISDVMMPDTCSHHVMNAAARVITNLSWRDHVKPALKQLYWLPVELRIITYKPCLFMYHIHTGQAPQYLSDCVSAVSALSGRYRLRSTGSADYVLPRTRELDLENEVSPTVAQPPGTLFLPTSTTLLTLVHSENDSRVYFMIVLTTDYCWRSWTCRIAAPYKFHVD